MPARWRGRPSARHMAAALAALSACALSVSAAAQEARDQPSDFTLGGISFLGDGPDTAAIGAGAFNLIPNDDRADTAGEFRLEYRHGGKWHALGPTVGIMANSEGGVFGYAGLYTDMRIADRWIVTPAAGIGGYARGDGKDLGGVFQFHVGLDVAYWFESGDRLGLKIAHISNAGLHDENPGVESLLLTYTFSLETLFGP